MNCHNCGTELPDGTAFCSFCGSAQAITEVPQSYETVDPATAPQEKKTKRHVGLIVTACIVALLAVIVAVGFATNWFGFYGPMTRMAVAAKTTVDTGNFTIVMTSKTESQSASSYGIVESKSTIQVDMDLENRDLTLYAKSQRDYLGYPYTSYICIYQGYLISGIVWNNVANFNKEDIREELDELFDTYQDPKDVDWEALFEEIKENTNTDLAQYFDIDAFEDCILPYYRQLNSNKWLKKNAGYSTTRENGVRYYHFDPNPYQFSKATMETFRNAFKNQDEYDTMMENLELNGDRIGKYDIEVSVGVQHRKLSEIKFKVDTRDLNMDITIEFQDFGTTEIPSYILEDMLLKG